MNADKLVKLLNLTTSDNDNEALLAIRMANDLLKKDELTWEKVISARLQRENKKPQGIGPAPATYDPDFVKYMFSTDQFLIHLDTRSVATRKFVLSLGGYFLKHGSLTEKQYESLSKIWNYFAT